MPHCAQSSNGHASPLIASFAIAQASSGHVSRPASWLWGILAWCVCLPWAHAQNQTVLPGVAHTTTSQLETVAQHAIAPAALCSSFSGVPTANTLAALETSLDQALSANKFCEQQAVYHAHLGSLYLQMGQISSAATALEKALLLQPDLPGAQLDYAQALAQLGETGAAFQLVRQVRARPDIDPGLRLWLQEATTETSTYNKNWSWSQLFQTTAGHETNLTRVTHANAITLYLSNGPVLVPLDESVKPQSGAAVKTLMAVQGEQNFGQAQLKLGAAIQTRNIAAQQVPNHHLLQLSAAYHQAVGPGTAQLRWQAHEYRQTDHFAYQDQALHIHYEIAKPPQPCKWGFGLGHIKQRYTNSPNLDSLYNHVRAEGSCQHGNRIETHWSLGTGKDSAQSPMRPGGDKNRRDVILRHERPAGQAAAQAWVRYTHTQDSEPYSPLLGPQIGSTQRIDWGTGLWWPLTGRWSVGIDVESTSQKSSNTLFNIRNLTAYAGLRWTGK